MRNGNGSRQAGWGIGPFRVSDLDWVAAVWIVGTAWAARAHAEEGDLDRSQEKGAIVVKSPTHEVLRYQLERPPESRLSVESACYVHPLATPKGVVLTDVAPEDHRHHRGLFLAWVEMHGSKDADFWGWGKYAPKDNRRIVTKNPMPEPGAGKPQRTVHFGVKNEWLADGDVLLAEDLQVAVREVLPANVVDLAYTLTPAADLTLAQWAFSGFCVRMRKDGKIAASGPDGEVKRADPKHTEPKSDWPDAPWYDFTVTFDDGSVAGAAVINHPKNPPTLWHNHRGIRMLNPCIVAPGAVTLKAKEPLALLYRVVAHDGPASVETLNRLAKEFSEAR